MHTRMQRVRNERVADSPVGHSRYHFSRMRDGPQGCRRHPCTDPDQAALTGHPQEWTQGRPPSRSTLGPSAAASDMVGRRSVFEAQQLSSAGDDAWDPGRAAGGSHHCPGRDRACRTMTVEDGLATERATRGGTGVACGWDAGTARLSGAGTDAAMPSSRPPSRRPRYLPRLLPGADQVDRDHPDRDSTVAAGDQPQVCHGRGQTLPAGLESARSTADLGEAVRSQNPDSLGELLVCQRRSPGGKQTGRP
jgi:hypothetical protein